MLNRILGAMAREDYSYLAARMQACVLRPRQSLENPNQRIEFIYFIESGVAAVQAVSAKFRNVVALVGNEGVSGLAVVLGTAVSPHATVMLSAGSAQRLPASDLREAMTRCPRVRDLLLRYSLAFHNQAAHTALANARGLVEQRVIRWLLMAHDRFPTPDIPITHEFTAEIIGSRRAGVSVALERLADLGVISLRRGMVEIVDREAGEKIAGAFYGLPEKEYERLITRWESRSRDQNQAETLAPSPAN